MSDNSQPQPVVQDELTKQEQPKYTVKLFGKYVPVWLVVLVIAVLAWVAWHMWTEHQKKAVRLTSSARVDLDKLAASSATPASAGIPLNTPSTEETRKQLNKLFNSF
jgi:hypothetical protein